MDTPSTNLQHHETNFSEGEIYLQMANTGVADVLLG